MIISVEIDANICVASKRINDSISIIIPTYKERDNIPVLLVALGQLRQTHDITYGSFIHG